MQVSIDHDNELNELKQQTQEKWGDVVREGSHRGFTIVPELLLRHQGDLEITAIEMNVLINLIAHWWYAERQPFPSDQKIADRMGVKPRTVQRAMASLEKKGLIDRNATKFRLTSGDYQSRRLVDLRGLKKKLGEL